MIDNFINTNTISILEKALNGTSLRNGVISNNIANVDTPGFKSSDVNFEDELKKAIDGQGISGIRTDSRHIPIGQQSLEEVSPQVIEDSNTSYRTDGNNVDIDNEMAKLAKNSIMYEALSQQISSQFSKLKYAISEGRR